MRKSLFVLSLIAVFGLSISYAQTPSMSKHAQRGVQCTACHDGSSFKPASASKCIVCHKQDSLAKKTERLNFISKMKNQKTGEIKEHMALINPHDSYHFGKTEDCNDCHREHRQSVNDCATCHDVKAWGMKDPK